MKPFVLKAITAISSLAILSGALTGCAPTPKTSHAVTACQDLSNPKSWSENWTYIPTHWGHGSKMYPGFGTFKCSEPAVLTMRFKPLGLNFVAGTTYLSYGTKQITIVNSPGPETKWFGSDLIVEISSGISSIKPDQVFQPVVEISQSHFGFSRGREPIRAEITLKAKGKRAITFVRTLKFDNSTRFSVSTTGKRV